MKNWSLMARARGLEIPEEELTRISLTLDALETVFRPLTGQLTSGTDMAVTYIAPLEKSE